MNISSEMGLPVIVRELRARVRGPRAFVLLTAYLVILVGFSYGIYLIATTAAGSGPAGPSVGTALFVSMAFLTMALVCLISPGVTAGAVSGEQERRTLDLLLLTPLSPAAILWSKLISHLAYVLLMIVAAVPVLAISFPFGGVTAGDVVHVLIVWLLCAVTYGVLGLFLSVAVRRTAWAMAIAYAILLLVTFGSYFLLTLVGVLRGDAPPRWLLLLNPIAIMASAISEGRVASDWVGGLAGLAGNFEMRPTSALLADVWLRPLWHYGAALYLTVSVVLFWLSVHLLRPIRRWRWARFERPLALLAIVALPVVAYVGFGPPSYARFGWPEISQITPTPAPVEPMPTPMPISVAPVPIASVIELPTGVTWDDVVDIYATVLTRALETRSPRPALVQVDAMLGGGVLQDPALDGITPILLEAGLFEAIARRVHTDSSARLISSSGTLSQGEAPDAVVTLGVVRWLSSERALVSVAWHGDEEVSTYTVERVEGRWEIAEVRQVPAPAGR